MRSSLRQPFSERHFMASRRAGLPSKARSPVSFVTMLSSSRMPCPYCLKSCCNDSYSFMIISPFRSAPGARGGPGCRRYARILLII